MMRHAFVGIVAALSLVAGCDNSNGVDAGTGTPDTGVTLMDGGTDGGGPGLDAGEGTDGGEGTDAGEGIDAGEGTDAGFDACVPVTCGASDCGMIDDGCGATVDCGLCAIGAACSDNAECMSGDCSTEADTAWYQGFCSLDCRTDSECGAGAHCGFTQNSLARIGRCVLDCGTDADCRGPEYTCRQADMFGPRECAPVGTGAGAIGDACTSNADCSFGEDWLCLREGASFRGGMCSRTCLVDGDCGSGNHCAFIPAGGGEGACLPDCVDDTSCRADGYVCTNADDDAGMVTECFPGGTGTGAVGSACTGIWDCGGGVNGACISEAQSALGGYCTIFECTTDADCGAAAHCSQYPRTGGGMIGVCQADCTSDADCRTTGGYACYDDNGDGVQECYIAGTGTGAPGATCTDISDCAGGGRGRCGTTIPGGYCFLTGCTTAGGVGADCPSMSHCSINLDPDTMVPDPTGLCLADCASDSDCPMVGQRCFDSADLDGVTECLPAATGPGTVGDVCADTYDCSGDEFGFCLLDIDNTGGAPDFPGGYCTQSCAAGAPPCPAGSTCLGGSVCVADCTMGSDCRPGTDYGCSMPAGASSTVCWPS